MTNRFLNAEKTLAMIDGTAIPISHRWWQEKVVPIWDSIEEYTSDPRSFLEKRKDAYKAEIDNGFFFECLYNEDLATWKAKMDEINAKYPEE